MYLSLAFKARLMLERLQQVQMQMYLSQVLLLLGPLGRSLLMQTRMFLSRALLVLRLSERLRLRRQATQQFLLRASQALERWVQLPLPQQLMRLSLAFKERVKSVM
jgi:hypothetical protein